MTFVTGSITSANPGPALYAALEPALVAAGFTLDDTVVIGTRTHKVLKSVTNEAGLPWFLDMHYPTTGIASGFAMAPFEDYNAATDAAFRGPYAASATILDPATFSRYGAASSALETNWANGVSATSLHLTLVTATITYWASITTDRVVIMLSSAPTQFLYCGFFKPSAEHAAHAGSALYPLISTRLTAGGVSLSASSIAAITAALTRVPRLAAFDATVGTVSPGTWADYLSISPLYGLGRVGAGGAVGAGASPFTGAVSVFPIPVSVGSSNPSSATLAAGVIGQLDGVASGYAAAAVSRGDTITIDGVTWYSSSVGGTANALFLEGV